MNILEKIENKLDIFSKSYKRIANYILNDYKQAIFLSCSDIAEKASVSDATVIRFARELGYNTYVEFITALRQHVIGKIDLAERIDLSSQYIKEDNYSARNLFDDAIMSLESSAASLSEEDLNKSKELYKSSNKIFVVGFTDNSPLAAYCRHQLKLMDKDVYLLNDNRADTYDLYKQADENTLVFYFAMGKIFKRDYRMIDYLKSRGCKIIMFANRHYEDILKECDMRFILKESPIVSSVYYLHMASMIIFQSICMTSIKENEHEITAKYKQLYDFLDDVDKIL